jgi:hypothetical protein
MLLFTESDIKGASMPTEQEISLQQQSLYDSAALRDDLNDAEATVLLTWAEGQVARVAKDFPDEFEQKNRFLRQVIKGINRFVGQREFNELDGQKEYMSKFSMYLSQLGWGHVTEDALFAALPTDKKDMAGTLNAILSLLSPAAHGAASHLPVPTESASPAASGAFVAPESKPTTAGALAKPENNPAASGGAVIQAKPENNPAAAGAVMPNPSNHALEKEDSESINQDDSEIGYEE